MRAIIIQSQHYVLDKYERDITPGINKISNEYFDRHITQWQTLFNKCVFNLSVAN